MRTRDVIAWYFSVSDLLELARLSLLGAVLVALNAACTAVERRIEA